MVFVAFIRYTSGKVCTWEDHVNSRQATRFEALERGGAYYLIDQDKAYYLHEIRVEKKKSILFQHQFPGWCSLPLKWWSSLDQLHYSVYLALSS